MTDDRGASDDRGPAQGAAELRRVRTWLWIFVVCLVLSGLTAFPLESESRWLAELVGGSPLGRAFPETTAWAERVRDGLADTNTRYPFLAYGTDWLAFAHLVIAVAFWGPLQDPVRNVWVIRWAMIACAGIIPLALICGPLRGIPLYWRFVDMSFGVVGVVPLLIVLRGIQRLERATAPRGESPLAA
ncbi:hypothetical protein [Kitasatospora sp. GP82]|uniref:hypothetical protein n=1 Tax=Kitasatospora sp. GP82 TaxID=3035089 RepID=UPI002476B1FE|nr:hypothetical protein [Kitasatospora sp. GP82]MDH6128168.1 hypothetical protein [Kitasatospora sp. GP82]